MSGRSHAIAAGAGVVRAEAPVVAGAMISARAKISLEAQDQQPGRIQETAQKRIVDLRRSVKAAPISSTLLEKDEIDNPYDRTIRSLERRTVQDRVKLGAAEQELSSQSQKVEKLKEQLAAYDRQLRNAQAGSAAGAIAEVLPDFTQTARTVLHRSSPKPEIEPEEQEQEEAGYYADPVGAGAAARSAAEQAYQLPQEDEVNASPQPHLTLISELRGLRKDMRAMIGRERRYAEINRRLAQQIREEKAKVAKMKRDHKYTTEHLLLTAGAFGAVCTAATVGITRFFSKK